MTNEEKQMRSKIAKEKGMGNWMTKVWAEGRASPNSLNALILNKGKGWLGKKQSKEHREKNRLSHLGKQAWNKGLTGINNPIILDAESRRKISIGNTGKVRTPEMRKRYSQSKIGRKLSKETKIKISSFQRGINTKEWDKFISREPYDQRWDNLFKNKIRQRDNQVCMLCGVHREKIKTALNVHHINYDKTISIPQNCISLCRQCHTKTNHNRESWIKFFQNIMNKRYNYIYNQEDNIVLNLETRK